MKRFITYLFYYEDGKKSKNVGFVKTDIQNNKCKMEIHLRNMLRFQGKAQIFLLIRDERVIGIELGKMIVTQGNGSGSFTFLTAPILESEYSFHQTVGIGIFLANQRYAASFWEETVEPDLLTGKFARYEANLKKKEEKEEPKGEVKLPEKDFYKIDMNGIYKLPKRNWYLCNNSFLLHGYFQYNYLIVKEKKDKESVDRYLGVPGYYERQEKVMAVMFGFGEFEPEKKEEPTKEGTFGYWLCRLES